MTLKWFGEDELINSSEFIICTYRHGFLPVEGYTDDCGWGCTIRSAQMLFANFLKFKLKMNMRDITNLISDFPENPLSIQNICKSGRKMFDKGAGEWYSPSQAISAISDCLSKIHDNEYKFKNVHEFDLNTKIEIYPTLLTLSTRLGPDEIGQMYFKDVKNFMKSPYSCGFVGGKKTSSYFFGGITEKDEITYLDPHEVRKTNDKSFECKRIPSVTKLEHINPTIVFAFYLKTSQDFEIVYKEFHQLFQAMQQTSVSFEEEFDVIFTETEDEVFI